MKKANYLCIILALVLLITNAHGQKPAITLTFNAQYQGEYVLLDSIYVVNLTQVGDTAIYAPNNSLVLNYSMGIEDMIGAGNNALTIAQNYPNPFTEQTSISIFMSDADNLQLSVTNLLGQKVAFYENSLAAGNHSFVFNPGADKYYILTAAANGLVRAIKMVSMNNYSGETGSLVYQGSEEIQVEYKSAKDINGFGYSLGDELQLIGYAKTSSNINGGCWIIDTPGADETYLFEIMEGVPCRGEPYVTYEGETYNTVQIGGQCWLRKNLNVGTMIPEAELPTNNDVIEKHCDDDNEANCDIYGGRYQWHEMMQYTYQEGSQSICPPYWQIPTLVEMETLTDFLGGETVAGGKMKEAGTAHWKYPNTGATNETGFTALPFGDIENENVLYWSSIQFPNAVGAYMGFLVYDQTGFYIDGWPFYISSSVRCLKNESDVLVPYVTTAQLTNITQTTATSGGNVMAGGNSAVTARGVCWSTSPNPTIADNKTVDGSGLGAFTSNITGLSLTNTFYVRAYATNSDGTAYGIQKTISDTEAWYPFDGDFYDQSGNGYHGYNAYGPTWTTDRNGNPNQALLFDGDESGVWLYPEYPPVFSGSLTVSMWVYFNDDGRDVLFGNYQIDGTYDIVNFEKHTNNKLRIFWNNGEVNFVTPDNVVSSNTWYFVTFVRNKEQDKFVIYVDGNKIDTMAGAGSDLTPDPNFWIGRDYRTGSTVTNGKIDDVRIFSRALSDQEVIDLYNY